MRYKFLSGVFILALAVIMIGCTDPLWKGKFSSSVFLLNNTMDSITVEYEDVEQDTTFVFVISPKNSPFSNTVYVELGEFQGDKNSEWPPEEYFAEKMSHLTIYRKVGDDTQQLSRTYYDESSDFELLADYEFDIHCVTYSLYVTEDMFKE